jgi:hypothetical protein
MEATPKFSFSCRSILKEKKTLFEAYYSYNDNAQ